MHQDKLRTQTSQIHSLALAPCVRTEIKKNKETLDFKGKQTLWGVSNIQPEGRSRRKIKEVIIFGFLSWPRRQGAMPKLSFSYDGNISLQTTRKWKKRQWNPTHFIYFSLAIMDRIDWIGLIQYKWKYSNSTCISLYIQRIIKWFYWSSPVWHPTKELALRPVSTIVYTKPVSSEGRAGHLLISFVVWSSLHVKVSMGNILNHRLLSDVLIGVSCVWRHRKKVLV